MGISTSRVVDLVLGNLVGFEKDKLDKVKNSMYIVLNDYDIQEKSKELANVDIDLKTKAVQMFFVTKKVEGCTDKTLNYYHTVLKRFFSIITSELDRITADDIRYYIAYRATQDSLSKVSQDNELRTLKSFFKWCIGDEYITKNPTVTIKPIKKEKKYKKAFSEIEIEKIRQSADNFRDKAIIEVLNSTGVRVSELCQMKKTDIENDEILVFGKGEKERVVFLNAKAMFALESYLATRKDNRPELFVSLKAPYNPIQKSSVEGIVRKLGEKAGVKNVHPHRFRRTAATLALNRGMPIEQVSQMLGHSKIETTTIYARSDLQNVKSSHKKYVV